MDLLLLQYLKRPFGPGNNREIELPVFVIGQVLLQRTEQNFGVGRFIIHQEDPEHLLLAFFQDSALSCLTGTPVRSPYKGRVKKNVVPFSASGSTHATTSHTDPIRANFRTSSILFIRSWPVS